MTIDLGAIPTEPIATVLERMASEHFKRSPEPVNFAVTDAQMRSVRGYMKGPSDRPHVVDADGVVWWPNSLLARWAFIEENPDCDEGTMSLSTSHVHKTIDGFTFFRFVKGAS